MAPKLPNTLEIYNTLKKYPLGNWLFSILFAFYCPYFFTIFAYVNDVKPGHSSVSLTQKWIIQNHIGTVHAIAVCNLVEMALGLVVEASVPKNLRWLPKGMDINYEAKARGRLTATADIDPATFFQLKSYPGEVKVPIVVRDREGVVVASAEVRLWLSEKPSKKDA